MGSSDGGGLTAGAGTGCEVGGCSKVGGSIATAGVSCTKRKTKDEFNSVYLKTAQTNKPLLNAEQGFHWQIAIFCRKWNR